ncbi:PEP-CTERM sorting domain-containing protein [Brumicola blandensis]|uniref:PEP-CTERM sorting domain-containing protein n=1 Tax=Brumicola blandensis TaxID=3075611 RepID=A0AAW8QYZ5_9ALTE|nr:PEP-CTERM sorting domain-containing protein [Alteromonas sp. W409]MDT0581095.1 PEP-CTERM sorting domain-containing protein [Alteromonas sp. W409]
MKFKSVIAVLALIASSAANASLISNGSFEAPGIQSGWTYLSDNSNGWQGDNIEVWRSGFNGVTSYEGNQHGELNAHPHDGTSFSIYQTFATTANSTYAYSLAYRARSNNDESFRLEIFTGDLNNRDHVVNFEFIDHTTREWSTFASSFIGSGFNTYFMLTSVNPTAATVGNFIDAVVVNDVSAPTSIALLGIALAGLISVRRRA